MEKTTRQREKTNFEVLFNLIVDPAVIVDAKGNILIVNKSFAELVGKKSEELKGTGALDLDALSADTKKIVAENFKKRI